MYLNKITIYGNLTRDPEMKSLPSGSAVVTFGVATNRTWKDKDGEKKEQTEFHNIVAFGRQAEVIAQYIKRGNPIYIEGRNQTRSWEGKEDKVKHYRTEVVLESFQFGASSERRDQAPRPAAAPGSGYEDKPSPSTADEMVEAEIGADADIPF